MENLRESSRVEARHFISYDVRNESGEVIYSGIALSRNLSRKGVQIEARQEFPINNPVRLHLAVEEDVVDVNGMIRHVEKADENTYLIGIEFTEIPDEILKRLAEKYPEILEK